MDAKELVRKLSQHPLVTNEMPLQIQLGLPFLELRAGKLCISFKAHRELCQNGRIEFYPQQYEIVWAYPFHKVIHFSSLAYERNIDVSKPVGYISLDRMAGGGRYLLDELYAECSRVISIWEQDRKVSGIFLKQYQELYYETAELLGLSELYGGCV